MHLTIYLVSIVTVLLFTIYQTLSTIMNPYVNISYKFIMLYIFFAALLLSFQRNTYLPFLGLSAFPFTLVKDGEIPKGANVETTISVQAVNGTKIAYWGAEPTDPSHVVATPKLAYADYKNAGVAIVQGGKATLKFFCPTKYNVPWGSTLERHVHYRIITTTGLISPVHTTYVKC